MSRASLKVIKNEVEVVIGEDHDPRLAGWCQAVHFRCRSDHEIIVDSVEECRTGGVIDQNHYLRVFISTRLPGHSAEPFEYPLYFRRANEVGRTSLRWFDEVSGPAVSQSAVRCLSGQFADDEEPDDFLLLARSGLQRLMEVATSAGGADNAIHDVAAWAYELGYMAAVEDIKGRAEKAADAGVAALAATETARAHHEHAAKARTEIILAIANDVADKNPAISLADWGRAVCDVIDDDDSLRAFLPRGYEAAACKKLKQTADKTVREKIKAASPPIATNVSGRWRPLPRATRRRRTD